MTFLVLALLVFGVGASVTRLITRDSLFEIFRDRWVDHFVAKQDVILHRLASELPAKGSYSDPALEWQERRVGLMREVIARSQEEQAIGFWVRGAAREKVQPWTWQSNRLVRLRGLIEFIGCPWCVGFWVFQIAWIFAWGVGLGFAYNLVGLPVWAVLPALALSYRWLYAVIASRLDSE